MLHTPVLTNELISLFADTHPPEKILDCTFGRGGHSLAFLKHFPTVQITALDRDSQAIEYGLSLQEVKEGKIQLKKQNFHTFPEIDSPQKIISQVSSKKSKASTSPQKISLENQFKKSADLFSNQKTYPPSSLQEDSLKQNLSQDLLYDLILMDLGVSSPQLEDKDRGFSFYQEGPLDMRMDRDQKWSAKDIINSWNRKDLIQLFQSYGEIKHPHKVVSAIIEQRRKKKFESTLELSHLIQKFFSRKSPYKHPATAWFLALRMFVNQELEGLESCLPHFLPYVKEGGFLAILSFHSLEDRIVKKAFRQFVKDKVGKLWNKKVIRPSLEEVKQNPRSRSTKLRVFQKTVEKRANI